MNVEMQEYLKIAHRADTERGRCTPFAHKFTRDEGDHLSTFSWIKDSQYNPKKEITAEKCSTCGYYHLTSKV